MGIEIHEFPRVYYKGVDKEGKREGMVGKEEKEDRSERHWEGSGG